MPIQTSQIYEQDCKFAQYQDHLRWSRFQTAAAIEAGLAYVIWGFTTGPGTKIFLSLVGLILVLVVLLLSRIDQQDYDGHMNRIRELESEQQERNPKDSDLPRYPYPRKLKPFSGPGLMLAGSLALLSFNIFLVGYALWLCCNRK